MGEHSIERVRQDGQAAIIRGADGCLYQVQRIDETRPLPTVDNHNSRLERLRRDRERNNAARSVSYAILGVGALFAGVVVLMIFATVLASATKPVAPVNNPNCWINCS